MIGKTLAHYEITGLLGKGGMGDVYAARDTKLGRDVAIKVLPAELANNPERRKRFTREAQAIAALKHPNIVTIYSVEESGDVHFITMELVEGKTLSELIPSDGLKLDVFFAYAVPLADAISSAHEQGITHRDLKPANVMFDRNGNLKVLDFGLAKLLDAPDEKDDARTMVHSDTAIGQIVGTAAYMSPEQAEGKPVDNRTDIFSLGIVLFQMATGKPPFAGDTQISTISAILKDTPSHISEIKSDVPRHVGRIVSHCLEKDPDSRYQSAKDVRNELIGVKKEVDSGDLSAIMESGVFQAPPPQTKSRKPLAFAALAILAVAIGVWVLKPSGSADKNSTTEEISSTAGGTPTELTSDANRKKMAVVLPFENLGPPEDAYFAAGMTDEITGRLSAVGGIGVISRSSATQYDRTGKTMRQIGKDLGVDYVLEGSVRWAKRDDGTGRVRITPQLIRVEDDTQIWSASYDREIDDIFDIQTEIANQMIDALGVKLTGSERQLVENAPTQNLEAYKLYLQAEELFQKNMIGSHPRYEELMLEATQLDPQFLLAWAKLTEYHMVFYSNFDKTDERKAKARKTLREAEALDPKHPQTHLARGEYYYYGFSDYDQALEEFTAATKSAPSNAMARLQVGNIHRRLGNWKECVENQRMAVLLDPKDGNASIQLSNTYAGLRDFESAVAVLDDLLDQARGDDSLTPWASFNRAVKIASWDGDLNAMKELAEMDADPRSGPMAVLTYQMARWLYEFWTRDYASALEVGQNIEMPTPGFESEKLYRRAMIHFFADGREAAEEALLEANRALEEWLDSAPDDEDTRSNLAMNLAMLGREDRAISEANLVVEQVSKDKFFGPGALDTLARVYALCGRQEEALDLLDQLLDTVYVDAITPYMLQIEPVWDNLRDNPRFQAMLPSDT